MPLATSVGPQAQIDKPQVAVLFITLQLRIAGSWRGGQNMPRDGDDAGPGDHGHDLVRGSARP